ncbi:MAG: recombinase family protein, partial [Syntrophales bacterium LBB04]|nr:recombinase family protein [Syntrophales bacterium LBB04]
MSSLSRRVGSQEQTRVITRTRVKGVTSTHAIASHEGSTTKIVQKSSAHIQRRSTMHDKINPTHPERSAYVYVRQSTAAQVQHNKESTDRQYKLAERALHPGWSQPQIKVIDEDLARSGSATSDRHGFALMTTEVALGHVGLILSIEVSRVARNNADWYRLLDLCGVTDTHIGDEDGIYHPGLFNDRLLPGLKGTMAEAEL